MRFQFLTLAAMTFTAIALAGCGGGTNTNTNNARANNSMTNLGANNANTLAVVTNANTNRWSNTNITREEYDKNRAEYERDKGSSTIGSGANDSWLWFKTRAALLTTNDLRESTIDVDAVNDVITLRGTVETAAQKAKAEQVAKDIDGVKSVKNELKVAPDDSMTNTGGSANSNSSNRR